MNEKSKIELTEAARAARREYYKLWRKNHRAECRSYIAKHWNKKAEGGKHE